MLPLEKPKDNVVQLRVVDGKIDVKPKVRYNKDGSVDKRRPCKKEGISSEVYPFTSEEEIKAMVDVFDKHINESDTPVRQKVAKRNKMLFLVGINLGLRASDFCGLTYSFFMNDDGSFKDFYSLKPKKTRKTNKFVKLYFNNVVKESISSYIKEYPIEDMNDYIFKSKKGGCITEKSLYRIIDETAKEAGLPNNYGSHSLRKSFGFHIWRNSEDKEKSLVILSAIFNHSSVATTRKYIGILDGEIEDVFNELDLGMDFL